MAEIQKTSSIPPGELAQRFVQFVMIQAQNILFLLGRLPSPEGDRLPPNLEAAKMLIDQMEMIREKTRGNLSSQETQILDNALSNVRLAFVETSGGTPASMMPSRTMGGIPSPDDLLEEPEEAPVPASKPAAPAPAAAAKPIESESKKKFTKTYG
jgi:Domain of unknown function (DUF1844)